MSKHPYETMELKVGQEVWVRAKVTRLFPSGTLGYAHGLVDALVITNGLAGVDQNIVTDVKNIKTSAP